jgi:CRISPR system Cascade subunit CasB
MSTPSSSPSATPPAIAPNITRYIDRLDALDPGQRARLKRNAGNTLAESRGLLPLFYRILPGSIAGQRDVETYFLVATLHGLNPRPGFRGNFAQTLANVAGDSSAHRDGIDCRVAILLDSHRGELPFRLRQAVRFVASHERPIDWPRLLHDLLRWDHPGRIVQRAWARSYFGTPD